MIGKTEARGRHCDQDFLRLFMEGNLSLDDELTFLVHLDDCKLCWDLVYEAWKARDAHLFQTTGKVPVELAS